MKASEKRVLEALASVDLIKILQELISVPSAVGHEERLADYIGELLQKDGFDVHFRAVEGERKNVIGTYPFDAPGRCLMFNGHLDTVAGSDGWDGDPHRAVRRDGRLYGLGALDMKGGIAASIAAMQALIASGESWGGSVLFSGVIDEEGYSEGARALLGDGLNDVDAIIIGEPLAGTEESPVPVLTTGKILYRVTVRGVQAHGFMPEQGVNAVEAAAKVIGVLERLSQVNHPRLGTGPVSTLKVHGGYDEYAVVVPDRCDIIISRMIVPGETRERCVEDLEELIEGLDLAAEVDVDLVPPYYAPFETDATSDLFRRFDAAYRDVHGRSPVYGPSSIITDASIFCGIGGIPTLVYGPSGGAIHQANEYIDLESLAACARTYALTAARFLDLST